MILLIPYFDYIDVRSLNYFLNYYVCFLNLYYWVLSIGYSNLYRIRYYFLFTFIALFYHNLFTYDFYLFDLEWDFDDGEIDLCF